jgi:hypothetical protein
MVNLMLSQSILCLVVDGMMVGCGERSGKSSGEATLFDMNQTLAMETMRSVRCPSDVNELTNFLSLEGKRLPQPPAGKKLVIDRAQRQVVFVDVPPGN